LYFLNFFLVIFHVANNHDPVIIEQVLYLLKIILKQNYSQYNNQFYQPNNDIAMGSPIYSTLAEV